MPANRLGFALSLCAVRYLGFCPEAPASWPGDVAWYVSRQLGLAPEAMAGYPEREQTRTGHLKRIYAHLGHRRPSGADLRELFEWLVERALELDEPALLVEVDRRTGFSRFFTHAGGSEPRTPELRVHLYASILAQATNVGPVRMAELSDLSYRKLAWASTWYLREDTPKDAVAAIVNFHHALPLSASWGGGALSSSDGQRFAVDVKARNARAIPRYFGHGRGVTHYSWTSDQYS